jgi:hypothetical protein
VSMWVTCMDQRTSHEKLQIFKSLFTGLKEVYGTYDPGTGKVRQVKEPVTDEVLLAHLRGEQPYGVYLLTGDTIRALAVDFDSDDVSDPLAFQAEARRHNLSCYIERSKSKGYHVWMFLTEKGVPARKARLVAASILASIGRPHTEIFPKQDALDDRTSFGNFINAPLFGRLVPKGRTVFIDPTRPTEPCPDQWELLAGVQRLGEVQLDGVIQSCSLERPSANDEHRPSEPANGVKDSMRSFGLPPCAQRMLAEGVSDQQRVSCFRLAVHLRRAGIPFDLSVPMLRAWARKNRPQNGKRVITDPEIEQQARDAFEKPYRSCGCEEPAVAPYCDERCPLHSRAARRPSLEGA